MGVLFCLGKTHAVSVVESTVSKQFRGKFELAMKTSSILDRTLSAAWQNNPLRLNSLS